MGEIRRSADGKYEVLESILPEGRKNEYSVIGFRGRTATAYQYIRAHHDAQLLKPILTIESVSIQGAEDIPVIAAIFADAANVMSQWSADVGKRWDGERVEEGTVTRLSSQIAGLPAVAHYSYVDAQTYMRERAELLADEFERGLADALFSAKGTDPVVDLAAKAYRDGRPLAECIQEMMSRLANGGMAIKETERPASTSNSRLRRHNILNVGAIQEVVDFLKFPKALVVIVSDRDARLMASFDLILERNTDLKTFPSAHMALASADAKKIVIGVNISPSGKSDRLLGLGASNMLILVDEAGEYPSDVVGVFNSYERKFSRQRMSAFNAEMERLGLNAKVI